LVLQGSGREGTKIVLAYLDKRRERGLVFGFRPFGDSFTLYPPGDENRTSPREIEFTRLKSIYFVKSHEGNKDYKENKLKMPEVYREGRKVEVSFEDGERMVGTTDGVSEKRTGFFFQPADPKSNNLEIFVVTSNCEEIRLVGANPDGSDRILRPVRDRGVFDPGKRLAAVQRVLRGESVEAVAKDLFIPATTLASWRALYFSGGPSALGVDKPT